jgi:hypothetical protein
MDGSATTYPDSFDGVADHPRRFITSLADKVLTSVARVALIGDMGTNFVAELSNATGAHSSRTRFRLWCIAVDLLIHSNSTTRTSSTSTHV